MSVGLNHGIQALQVASASKPFDRLVCPRVHREDAGPDSAGVLRPGGSRATESGGKEEKTPQENEAHGRRTH